MCGGYVCASCGGTDWHQSAFSDVIHQKVRRVIACELEDENPFDSKGKVDKSYFGDHRKGNRARGAAGKITVFNILKRDDGV